MRRNRAFVELGRAPIPSELTERTAMSAETVVEGWGRLHDARALVLDDRDRIRMDESVRRGADVLPS